jgi:hypothetical protein
MGLSEMIWFYEGPMMEARAAFFPHHYHHPCLAASRISFLGGIGIALPSLHHVLSPHRVIDATDNVGPRIN